MKRKPPKKPQILTKARRVPPAEGRGTRREIAAILAITHSTLQFYLQKPEAPKPDKNLHYDIQECRDFINSNMSWGTLGAEMAGHRAAKVKVEIATKMFDLQVKKGLYIAKEEIGRTLIPLVQEIADLICQEYEMILPPKYIGKNAIECAQLNAEARDRIACRFKAGALAAEEALMEATRKVGS